MKIIIIITSPQGYDLMLSKAMVEVFEIPQPNTSETWRVKPIPILSQDTLFEMWHSNRSSLKKTNGDNSI